MDAILDDFQKLIVPATTHWNHPAFMAYFANSSTAAGVLGEDADCRAQRQRDAVEDEPGRDGARAAHARLAPPNDRAPGGVFRSDRGHRIVQHTLRARRREGAASGASHSRAGDGRARRPAASSHLLLRRSAFQRRQSRDDTRLRTGRAEKDSHGCQASHGCERAGRGTRARPARWSYSTRDRRDCRDDVDHRDRSRTRDRRHLRAREDLAARRCFVRGSGGHSPRDAHMSSMDATARIRWW